MNWPDPLPTGPAKFHKFNLSWRDRSTNPRYSLHSLITTTTNTLALLMFLCRTECVPNKACDDCWWKQTVSDRFASGFCIRGARVSIVWPPVSSVFFCTIYGSVNYGFGVEYNINNHWSAGVDFTHRSLSGEFPEATKKSKLDLDTLSIRLAYRF